MTCEEARKFLWKEPFQPVRVHLKDGRIHDIFHPRHCMAAEAILIIGSAAARDPAKKYPRGKSWVQWAEVDTIELLPTPAAPTT